MDTTTLAIPDWCFPAWVLILADLHHQGQDQCNDLHRKAWEFGINFYDTANQYHNGDAELAVGEALSPSRETYVLATKLFWPLSDHPFPTANDRGLSRKQIFNECHKSLSACRPITSTCTSATATTSSPRLMRPAGPCTTSYPRQSFVLGRFGMDSGSDRGRAWHLPGEWLAPTGFQPAGAEPFAAALGRRMLPGL